jgi:putative heme-binding domain-containing protein
VGPDLTGVGSRLSREDLLRSMVQPNARIAPGYGTVSLTLKNGDSVRGVLSAETDTQITVTSGGQEWIVDKSEIEQRTNSPSGMPAMGNILSRNELRDLVEFLTTLGNGY